MKKSLIIFIVGLVVGSGSYWTFRDGPLATKLKENRLVQKVGEAFDERSTGKLKEEMEKQGKIVKTKPAESSIAPLDDAKLADLAKAKVAAELVLSDEVTFRGSANSYEQVARATRLALECGAPKTLVSTIEVNGK